MTVNCIAAADFKLEQEDVEVNYARTTIMVADPNARMQDLPPESRPRISRLCVRKGREISDTLCCPGIWHLGSTPLHRQHISTNGRYRAPQMAKLQNEV
jgi:hypothetical protein